MKITVISGFLLVAALTLFILPAHSLEIGDKLTASDGASGDYFGRGVSISDDMAIVGAWFNDDNGRTVARPMSLA